MYPVQYIRVALVTQKHVYSPYYKSKHKTRKRVHEDEELLQLKRFSALNFKHLVSQILNWASRQKNAEFELHL